MVIDSNFKEVSFQALAVMCNKGILHRMYKNLKNKSSTKNNLIKKWDIELNKETKKPYFQCVLTVITLLFKSMFISSYQTILQCISLCTGKVLWASIL